MCQTDTCTEDLQDQAPKSNLYWQDQCCRAQSTRRNWAVTWQWANVHTCALWRLAHDIPLWASSLLATTDYQTHRCKEDLQDLAPKSNPIHNLLECASSYCDFVVIVLWGYSCICALWRLAHDIPPWAFFLLTNAGCQTHR